MPGRCGPHAERAGGQGAGCRGAPTWCCGLWLCLSYSLQGVRGCLLDTYNVSISPEGAFTHPLRVPLPLRHRTMQQRLCKRLTLWGCRLCDPPHLLQHRSIMQASMSCLGLGPAHDACGAARRPSAPLLSSPMGVIATGLHNEIMLPGMLDVQWPLVGGSGIF